MNIIADENIPYVQQAFAGLGDVTTMPGRAMDPAAVRDAELLLVRSITKVNAALLDDSSVRFVATATIGEDHIDKPYLAQRDIAFASAPGSNANSVAQYITSTLITLAESHDLYLPNLKLGIIGVGNVGTRVHAKAAALGMTCLLNDPPLQRQTGDPKYRSIDELLDCDIITLHVPLTLEGPDPTHHLADETFIRKLKPGAILINTSRGPVAHGEAIKRALDDGHLRACVLDVWEGEPDIDTDLLQRVAIATPHIAGYSFDGKVNGTRMIYEAACAFLGIDPTWDPTSLLPEPECPEVRVDSTLSPSQAVTQAVRAVFDIRRDDTAMRQLLTAHDRPALFDQLRKQYPRRREFFNTAAIVDPPNADLAHCLQGLGFQIQGT